MRNLTARVFRLLREQQHRLAEDVQPDAERVAGMEHEILSLFQSLLAHKISTVRIRCHGDYHLGQVLYTGRDFVIIDFEGEPARSLAERRLKSSPLRDVAGMLRSFDYAAHAGLLQAAQHGPVRLEDVPVLEPWARFWRRWTSSAFLRSYLHRAGESPLVPHTRDEIDWLLTALLLEKCVYEVGYELDNRPDWVKIPLQGILRLVGKE
jgi:maltose alpha-D-glucosyltransferase/alpha-amylase